MPAHTAPTYAVVIPAYNEARTLRAVVQRTLTQTPAVIVVDDGSQDGTGETIHDLPVMLLRNDTNQGKAASLWRGALAARAQGKEAVITLDADGQHAPEDIPLLLNAAQRHPQSIIIAARRLDPRNGPKSRYFGNKIANFWISWACGYRLQDSQSGFRLYPIALFSQLRLAIDRAHSFVFESEILIEAARQGVRSVAVSIAATYPKNARPSHYGQALDTSRITRMVAWKLVSRGLFLSGFIHAFMRRQEHND